jgi:hypothetical protein
MSVLTMVADQDFQALPLDKQQMALSALDSEFKNLNPEQFTATVQGLQKRAMARPDLVAPPSVASGLTQNQAVKNVVNQDLGGGNQYQAAENEQTPEGNLAAIRQREDLTSSLGVGGNAMVQPAIGFAKGAGDTVENTVGRVLPGQAPPEGTLEATNGWQTSGKVLENLAEFLAGEEALKGLSETERFSKLMPTMKLLEQSPKLRAIVSSAMRQGTVAGLQTLGKGGTPKEALRNAGIVGLTGVGFGAVNEYALPPIVRQLAKTMQNSRYSKLVQDSIASIFEKTAGAEGIETTAADPYGARATTEFLKAKYKNVANRLDELSAADTGKLQLTGAKPAITFSEAQQAVEDASQDFTREGRQAYRQATQDLNDLVEKYKPQLQAEGFDVDRMNKNYQAAMATKRIATFLMKTTEETGKEAEPLTATIKPGKQLQDAILDLSQNQKELFEKAGWTQEDINRAVGFARRMDNPIQSKMLSGVWDLLCHKFGLPTGGFISGAYVGGKEGYQRGGVPGAIGGAVLGGAVGATGGAVLNKGGKYLVNMILSTPWATKIIEDGFVTKADPKLVAEAFAAKAGENPSFLTQWLKNFGTLGKDESGNLNLTALKNSALKLANGENPFSDELEGLRIKAQTGSSYETKPTISNTIDSEGNLVQTPAVEHAVKMTGPNGEDFGVVRAIEDQPNTLRVIESSNGSAPAGNKIGRERGYVPMLYKAQDIADARQMPVTVTSDKPSLMSEPAKATWEGLKNTGFDVTTNADGRYQVTMQPQSKEISSAAKDFLNRIKGYYNDSRWSGEEGVVGRNISKRRVSDNAVTPQADDSPTMQKLKASLLDKQLKEERATTRQYTDIEKKMLLEAFDKETSYMSPLERKKAAQALANAMDSEVYKNFIKSASDDEGVVSDDSLNGWSKRYAFAQEVQKRVPVGGTPISDPEGRLIGYKDAGGAERLFKDTNPDYDYPAPRQLKEGHKPDSSPIYEGERIRGSKDLFTWEAKPVERIDKTGGRNIVHTRLKWFRVPEPAPEEPITKQTLKSIALGKKEQGAVAIEDARRNVDSAMRAFKRSGTQENKEALLKARQQLHSLKSK